MSLSFPFTILIQKPRDCRGVDLKKSRNIGPSLLAGEDHGQSLLTFGEGELVATATDSACFAGGIEACPGALPQHLPLEFRKVAIFKPAELRAIKNPRLSPGVPAEQAAGGHPTPKTRTVRQP